MPQMMTSISSIHNTRFKFDAELMKNKKNTAYIFFDLAKVTFRPKESMDNLADL